MGYHSRGLFQIWEEPGNLAYLIEHHWPNHLGAFDIEDPIDNAILAMSYLSALHDRFGNWYEALVFYNSGRLLKDAPKESKDYARRIILAMDPNI
jgi:soluble lytic murein transglycosylase-like protein